MSQEQTITVRRPKLTLSGRIDPLFLTGQPELAYALMGISLVAPYAEAFLIRAMAKAKWMVTDPALREMLRLLNGQEGQHTRLHNRFNAATCGDIPEVAALQEEIARDYARLGATHRLEWQLAFTEGLEAATVAIARFLLDEQVLRDGDPGARDLFEWHCVEELEHRSVAFELNNHLGIGRAYRAVIGVHGQAHFIRWMLRAARLLLERDRATGREHGTRSQNRARLIALVSLIGRRFLPRLLATYAPWYAPDRTPMPASAEPVLRRIAGWDPLAELDATSTATLLAAA